MNHSQARSVLKDRIVGLRIGRNGGRYMLLEAEKLEAAAREANDTRHKWYLGRMAVIETTALGAVSRDEYVERYNEGLRIKASWYPGSAAEATNLSVVQPTDKVVE